MNFNLKLDDEHDRAIPRRSVGPPRDFTSRAFRLRLMSLFAALVLVVVLMQEAGKPERWAWMGFDQVPGANELPVANTDPAGDDVLGDLEPQPRPAFWDSVVDDTPVGHVGDASAWPVAWQQVLERAAQSPDGGQAIAVKRVQLMSQPAAYRGRWVTLAGWIRSARFVPRPLKIATGEEGQASDLVGQDERQGYYELWIRPQETNAGPYCVYALNVPEDFPIVGNDFRELNHRVVVPAVFFKRRTYVAADGEATACPLLLANSFQLLAAASSADDSPAWMPSLPQAIRIALALALMAAGIAWWARWNALTPRYQPGVESQRAIDGSLDRLRTDPVVMTERQRVRELEQQLNPSLDSEQTNE